MTQNPKHNPAKRLCFGEEAQGSEMRNAHQGVPNGADFAPTRGGGADDVEEMDVQSHLLRGRYGNPHVPVYHKCVLAARLQPKRLTF